LPERANSSADPRSFKELAAMLANITVDGQFICPIIPKNALRMRRLW
jgi:hypothetical protein